MANTNTNTDDRILLSTDIYDVSGFLDQIRQDHIPDIDETSAMVGIFGYMNEMFSQSLQNSLIVSAETSNEAIPTRAKFVKNVINHAMNLNITDIYAKPASMTLMIYLPIDYIERNFVELNEVSGRAKFILDRKCPIFIDKYEYHLDYDVIINRIKNPQGVYVYTAIYDLFETGTTNIKQANPLSEINNPYITTLIQATIDSKDYIAFSARLHQVEMVDISNNILTNNSIENKSVTFSFEDQLASFDIDVIENNKTIHLTPVYAGLLDNTLEDGKWCYYEFLNEFTIRILFSKDSYVPKLNSRININIQLCSGSSANFTYTTTFRTSLKSEKYNDYNGMYAIIHPLQNGISNGGKDKKSVSDLRKIIPREASSRGAIINTTDLNNFFNSINDDRCKLYFFKKRDNQFERMYYAYMLIKKDGYVYPTNTIGLKIEQKDFKGFSGNNNLVLSPGTKFYYYNHGSDTNNDYATITKPELVTGLDPEEYPYPMTTNADGDLVRVFEYMSPFLISIDDDLISAYIMTLMNDTKIFKFASINTASDIQFISTNMNWSRKFITGEKDSDGNEMVYDNKYIMKMDIMQNTNNGYSFVKYNLDDNGNKIFSDIRIKTIMVLYADDTQTNPYRYIEGVLDDISSTGVYSFKFTLGTNDLMDLNNRINITGIYNTKPEALQPKSVLENSHGYMNKNTFAKIFILADFGKKVGDNINGSIATEDTIELYGDDNIGNRTEIENILPTKEDIIDALLNNDLYLEKDGIQKTIISVMRSNSEYMQRVTDYNGSEQETELAILRYLRNNKNSDFVKNILLNDEDVIEIIDSYNYVDLSRYTVCNTFTVDGGIDFYHDYTNMMRSTVTVKQMPKTDSSGNQIYKEINRTDAYGNTYTEYKPIYLINDNGMFIYDYTIDRIPMIKYDYFTSENMIQDYIFDLEERRKYINECLLVLEDTFDVDLKFFNTYGPSKMFYYNIPTSQNFKVKVAIKELKIFKSFLDEDDNNSIITKVPFGTELSISKVKGQWGYISLYDGWVKLLDTTKCINYIDNVSLRFKWALEAETSADKYISNNIISNIKDYIEDINDINELHIPNIITLITNNYREQLVYFEFLGVNEYGSSCQHLYLDESIKINADITPEFLNVETKSDGITPDIEIVVY